MRGAILGKGKRLYNADAKETEKGFFWKRIFAAWTVDICRRAW